MRFSPTSLCLTIIAICSTFPAARAQGESFLEARTAARRELELAKIELRHYWIVEYPRHRRELNAAIELTEAEIRNYKERLRAYWPYTRFSTGQPFLVTLQNLRMCLREAELRLTDLQAERNALVRFHSDEFKLLALNVQEARLRVAEIEASNIAVVEPAPEQP